MQSCDANTSNALVFRLVTLGNKCLVRHGGTMVSSRFAETRFAEI